ncbi:hypothetical protein Q7O_003826 [Pectobacterium carotovorum subsp. carotovorum PCCS1]|nr:hypothetical protein [Pectobacterium carotovorum subsp. carotovorum PCCS1]
MNSPTFTLKIKTFIKTMFNNHPFHLKQIHTKTKIIEI